MAAEMTGYFQTEIEEGDNRKNSSQKIGCTETKDFGNVSTQQHTDDDTDVPRSQIGTG